MQENWKLIKNNNKPLGIVEYHGAKQLFGQREKQMGTEKVTKNKNTTYYCLS